MPDTPVKNILGEDLLPCCTDPMTGIFRDGFCYTNEYDRGSHVVRSCDRRVSDVHKGLRKRPVNTSARV